MTTVKQMLDRANACATAVAVGEAMLLANDPAAVFVDVRDSAEISAMGKIPGAIHVSRGMLEFVLDRATPYFNPALAAGKRITFYCASGGRSALAAETAQAMGLTRVTRCLMQSDGGESVRGR